MRTRARAPARARAQAADARALAAVISAAVSGMAMHAAPVSVLVSPGTRGREVATPPKLARASSSSASASASLWPSAPLTCRAVKDDGTPCRIRRDNDYGQPFNAAGFCKFHHAERFAAAAEQRLELSAPTAAATATASPGQWLTLRCQWVLALHGI